MNLNSYLADRRMARRALTLALALLGVGVFWLLGLPLPFLFGPMFACLIAALAGLPLRGLGKTSVALRTILGVAVGCSITPAVISQLPDMMASVALLPLYILLIAAVGVPYFHRVCRFDPVTSWYAAMPGGLQDMILFGIEAGGDSRALSLIHATRVLIIVTVVPFVITHFFGASLDNPIGAPAADLSIVEMGLMAVAAVVGWKGGERIGLFGASILGPMILAGALSLAGFIHTRPPAEAILIAQFGIGVGIGVGYVGVTLNELRRIVLAGIVFVLILASLAAVFTEIVVYFGLADPLDGFLAYSPGGQAEMAVLAIIAGADIGFVVVHHLTRLLLVITLAPTFARLLSIRSPRTRRPDRRP
ncbi:MAG: AbrB family transcriptional regulator [Acuticoccus sp.]